MKQFTNTSGIAPDDSGDGAREEVPSSLQLEQSSDTEMKEQVFGDEPPDSVNELTEFASTSDAVNEPSDDTTPSSAGTAAEFPS